MWNNVSMPPNHVVGRNRHRVKSLSEEYSRIHCTVAQYTQQWLYGLLYIFHGLNPLISTLICMWNNVFVPASMYSWSEVSNFNFSYMQVGSNSRPSIPTYTTFI